MNDLTVFERRERANSMRELVGALLAYRNNPYTFTAVRNEVERTLVALGIDINTDEKEA